MRSLFACPACSCHVREGERICPHCDRPLASSDGISPRTAAATMMGLAAVLTYSVGGCGVKTHGGTGGGSYTGAMVVQSAYATGPSYSEPCYPNQPTQRCHDCIAQGLCGPADGNRTLAGNCASDANNSYALYHALFECLCGVNYPSGACGANCVKTCSGGPYDDATTCYSCIQAAFTGTCKMQYAACYNDH